MILMPASKRTRFVSILLASLAIGEAARGED